MSKIFDSIHVSDEIKTQVDKKFNQIENKHMTKKYNSITEVHIDLHGALTKKVQLMERHKTIMEAWDDKSKSKTNLKLAAMYNDCHYELKLVENRINELEKIIASKFI